MSTEIHRCQIKWLCIVALLLLVPLHDAAAAERAALSDVATYDTVVQPFLRDHCVKCHGAEKTKGGVRLDRIDGKIALGREFETWTAVFDQLAHGGMPPEEEKAPTVSDRKRVLAWIGGELEKARASDKVRNLLRQFAFGNHVDHKQLFSGEIQELPYSPPRLWRMNPNIYDRTKKRILKDDGLFLRRVRQPFALNKKEGISDYATGLFADSATLETLLRNARSIVDYQLTRDVPEIFHTIMASKSPSQDQIDAAIRLQFETLVYRRPTPEERKRYRKLFIRAMKKADVRESLRVCLKAIALSPEAVYRRELGLGEEDEHGRRRLSARELTFALAFALTDDPPDDLLVTAAREGTLRTRKEVTAQVERILDDGTIAKPRILRFFREFFGYHRAIHVFKDAKRFRNYDFGIVPAQLVHEADLLVLHILNKDKRVLKELLTTKRYFVGHVGSEADPKALQERLVALRLLFEYWKVKPWQKLEFEFPPGARADVEALHPYFRTQPMKHRMSGSLVKEYMRYLTVCYRNGIRPMLAQFILMEHERERNLTSGDDHRCFLHAYNLSIEKFDCPVEQPFVLNPKQRAGLLTHPAWLIAHSKNTETNPITRGKWVRERLLAGHVPDVPITVDAVIPDDPQRTLRERFKVTSQSECWRCHKKMNPLGMPFEMFDDFGRYRTVDESSGKPIDASGRLDSTGDARLDGDVESALELVHRLADSARVRQSFVRHAFRFWMGRNEMLSDSRTLLAADRAYVKSGGSFRTLLVSLLTSDSFLFRKDQADDKKYGN